VKVPVQLYVRVKLDDGSYPYLKAVMQPNNGHVRPDYAMKAGRVMRVQGGVYHLSYRKDGKRVWEPVGTDAGVALVKLTAKKREFEDAKLKHRAKLERCVGECRRPSSGVAGSAQASEAPPQRLHCRVPRRNQGTQGAENLRSLQQERALLRGDDVQRARAQGAQSC